VILNGKIKLMNMKENIISKIKLMMSYDMGKTLIENKETNNLVEDETIDEQGSALATLKNLGKGSKTAKAVAQDIVATMSKGGPSGEAIHIIGTNNNIKAVTSGDELLVALKSGSIDAVNLGRVNKGILKSGAVTDVNVLRNIASDVVYETGFVAKYGKDYLANGENSARKLLQDNGYTRNAIDEMIKKMKSDANYGKDVAALEKGAIKTKGDLKKSKATSKTQKATIKSQGEKIKELEAAAANPANITKGEATTAIGTQINYGTVTKEAAAETNAAVNGAKNIAPEVKATANEASTVVKEMKPSRWERWKAWAKKNPKSSKAIIFLGLSLTGWALYKMFSSNDRKNEVKKTLFANCAGDLLDTENSKILSMEDGSPVIYVSPTGNKEYDSKKGLKFLSNNRVFSGDNTMRGTWGCKGSTIGVQSEQTGLLGTDLGISALTKMAQNKEINKADSVGNVLNKINITWDTNSSGGDGKDNSGGGGGSKSTIPAELKDVDGVKKFQTWLDSKHGGWHSKYGTLNDNTLKGWGKYGPNTTKAWSQYKDEYLNGSTASGTETPNPSAEVDVTKPSGIPGSPDMVGKSGLNLDVNRIKVTNQDVSNEIDKEVQPSNTDLTNRQKEILSNVKNRGVDKVYKGGTLTPEEQQWLSKYYGGVVRKIKNEKGYGQKTVIDVPKKETTSKEPLSEENIIKKIVSKNLKSLIK